MTSPKWSLMAATLAGSVAILPQVSFASSHREATAIAGMPRVDGTDLYMFRSYETGRQDFVTLIANYFPVQAPYGGPNFFTLDNDARYDIKIDSDGDAVADLTFRFKFETNLSGGTGITLPIGDKDVAIPLRNAGSIANRGDANINEIESFRVSLITGAGTSGVAAPLISADNPDRTRFIKPIDNIGNKSIGLMNLVRSGLSVLVSGAETAFFPAPVTSATLKLSISLMFASRRLAMEPALRSGIATVLSPIGRAMPVPPERFVSNLKRKLISATASPSLSILMS